jgi:hypothetical protein
VIVVGFILMRLIMNIQRIAPHQMVGVPQPTTAESAPPQATAAQSPAPKAVAQHTAQPPAASVAPVPVGQAPSRAPSPPPVTVAEVSKKTAAPAATPAPSIAIPEAFVPAFANANPAAKASIAPKKEPEVRRAEPVKPEDLAKAEITQKPVEPQGPNQIAIKPLKKTYIKVVVDNGAQQPAFERWISPADGPVEFRGQKIAVRVLDRDAVQIKKNGKPIAGGDDDITVE